MLARLDADVLTRPGVKTTAMPVSDHGVFARIAQGSGSITILLSGADRRFKYVGYFALHSPERLVLAGGVMTRAQLYPLVRVGVSDLLAGYLASPSLAGGLERYIVPLEASIGAVPL